jgi:hypothetical protein
MWRPSLKGGDLDDGIYGGINSFTGAINLAIALGANQFIYWCGYASINKTIVMGV